MMKRFTVKFLNEEAVTQPAIVSGDTTQEEMNKNEEDALQTDITASITPTIQEQDVEGMEDTDVMNYVYFNAPNDIDEGTRQALFNRADQIRQKQMNGSTTPKDQEEFAKGVIAAASQSKNKATMGEAYTSGRVDGGDEYDFSGAEHWFDDKKTLEEFCIDLSYELGANIERELGIPESKTWQIIGKWIQDNRDWVQERFGLHDEVTESDIIRARKMILPILSKKFSTKH